jgi:hypothetical protein
VPTVLAPGGAGTRSTRGGAGRGSDLVEDEQVARAGLLDDTFLDQLAVNDRQDDRRRPGPSTGGAAPARAAAAWSASVTATWRRSRSGRRTALVDVSR